MFINIVLVVVVDIIIIIIIKIFYCSGYKNGNCLFHIFVAMSVDVPSVYIATEATIYSVFGN
jgi:hypothetical protein